MVVINWSEQPLTVWAAAAVVYLGTIFQIGFFFAFGIEFISFTGLTDWFFAASVMGMFCLAVSVPVGFVIGYAYFGRWILFPKLQKLRREGRSFSMVSGLLLGLSITAVVTVAYIRLPPRSFFIAAVLAVSLAFLIVEAVSRYPRRFGTFEAVGTFVLLTLAAFVGGAVYSAKSGRDCTLKFSDGRLQTVRYMRSVPDGHLARIGQVRYFYRKEDVTEVSCERLVF